MSLKAHYDKLYLDAIESFKNDTYVIDNLIDSPLDNRFGITLLARPPIEIKESIQQLIGKAKILEPNQYFYRNSDMHITVMSVISCFDGFKLEDINIQDYIQLINQSLKNINSFNITFKGITAAPSGIMIQGFMEDSTLNELRNNLRNSFKASGLLQSIDKRYAIKTAHATVMRFQDTLKNKNDFLDLIESYRTYNFGTFEVSNLELVFNDWYQKAEKVKQLHKFSLD